MSSNDGLIWLQILSALLADCRKQGICLTSCLLQCRDWSFRQQLLQKMVCVTTVRCQQKIAESVPFVQNLFINQQMRLHQHSESSDVHYMAHILQCSTALRMIMLDACHM